MFMIFVILASNSKIFHDFRYSHMEFKKNENFRILCESYENHENHIIPQDKHETQENA